MNKNKICFTDIDGVLNRTTFGEDLYFDTFENQQVPLHTDLVDNFRELIESDPFVMVVWTTDWRHSDEKTWHSWLNPRLWLESQAWLEDRILGKTLSKMSSEHFHDIKWWLDDNPDIENYVILEDSYFPEEWFGLEKHLVRVDSSRGFDRANLQMAKNILNIR